MILLAFPALYNLGPEEVLVHVGFPLAVTGHAWERCSLFRAG